MDYIEFLKLIGDLPPAHFIRTWAWAYPILETVHVVGLGLLLGGILAFDLRVLGVHKAMPVRQLAGHLLPLVWIGFALNATSGILLLMSDATTFGVNTSFQFKMVLIACAGINMVWFHWRVYPGVDGWNQGVAAPAAAKLTSLLSITIWLCVVTAGRMIAYIP